MYCQERELDLPREQRQEALCLQGMPRIVRSGKTHRIKIFPVAVQRCPSLFLSASIFRFSFG